MLTFSGAVLNYEETDMVLREKDKDGNRTGPEVSHKMVNVQMICKDVSNEKKQFVLIVQKFDPAADFKKPKSGDMWTTPEIRKFEVTKGIAIAQLF